MSVPSPELPRPEPPRTWREQLAGLAESLDVTAGRLVAGAIALACAGFIGWRLLAPSPPPPEMTLPFAEAPVGEPAEPMATVAADGGAAPSPVVEEVVVHVAGAVASPGVQRLAPGSRVIDAVEAAGGPLPDADLARVNLAAPLADGQQVYVPLPGEEPPVVAGPGGGGTAGGGLVNVNTATGPELETLPGVGPSTAAAIIAHRDANGPFTSVDQLIDVRGIGEAKLAALRDLVSV
jgi:competence protein ComEA